MDNGATEIPGTSFPSKLVFLGGPIRYWWTPTTGQEGPTLHETARFRIYAGYRDTVRDMLSEHFMVYAPHLALKGPWDEGLGNAINDSALDLAHAFFRIDVMDHEGKFIPAKGTDREQKRAEWNGIPVYRWTFREDSILESMDTLPAVIDLMKEELDDHA